MWRRSPRGLPLRGTEAVAGSRLHPLLADAARLLAAATLTAVVISALLVAIGVALA